MSQASISAPIPPACCLIWQRREAFYTHIRGGHAPSPELLANLRSRYEAVGGRTPLLDVTRQQACALEQALGSGYRVFVGMKHWHPYIAEAVAEMEAVGIERAV